MAEPGRDETTAGQPWRVKDEESPGGTGLTGEAEVVGPGADAGVTSSTRATATGANLGETEAVRESAERVDPSDR